MSELTKLESIWFRGTSISDLSEVSKHRSVVSVWAEATKISSLEPLSKNRKLKWLSIADTKVVDLSPLDDLPELATLVVTGSSVSTEELGRFQKKNPNCLIVNVQR